MKTFAIPLFASLLLLGGFPISVIAGEPRDTLDGRPMCFPDEGNNRSYLRSFLSDERYSPQRQPLSFSDNKAEVTLLNDKESSEVCEAFNEIYTDLIAERQVELERYDELSDRIDPQSYSRHVSYYAFGGYYFVIISDAPPAVKHSEPGTVYVSTASRTHIFVHDADLNLVATRACPGATCSDEIFKKIKRKYSPDK